MICPICECVIDDDDYWAGDRCLRCALEERPMPDVFICPQCGDKGLPSAYLPMCTACANAERAKSKASKKGSQ